VRRAQRGDERAFSVLVRAYQPLVFTFVLRMVRDRSLAEDLTQEIFLRVFQTLPGFSFRCKFTTWLLQVAKNRVLDELRERDRRPRHLVPLDDVPAQEVVDAPLERRETVAGIWQAIERLPVDLKMALLLRDVAGLHYTEIADTLDITLATVKWRIFKARDDVALALAPPDVPRTKPQTSAQTAPVAIEKRGGDSKPGPTTGRSPGPVFGNGP
jgi:RNA polymerase sigma-70 factor (ECF subfamily)